MAERVRDEGRKEQRGQQEGGDDDASDGVSEEASPASPRSLGPGQALKPTGTELRTGVWGRLQCLHLTKNRRLRRITDPSTPVVVESAQNHSRVNSHQDKGGLRGRIKLIKRK